MEKTIRCVVLYYETGKSGKEYREKENHRITIDEDIDLRRLEETIRDQGGIEMVAERTGIGRNISLFLGRLCHDSQTRYAINTDKQLKIELPYILSGEDKLQILVYPRTVVFAKKESTIVLSNPKSGEAVRSVPTTKNPTPKVLTDAEQNEINKELDKLSNSFLVKDLGKTASSKKHRNVDWPWKIKCGNCCATLALRYDANLEGRISKFKIGHYSACTKMASLKRFQQMSLESVFSGELRRINKNRRKAKHAKTDPPNDSDIERISSDEIDTDTERISSDEKEEDDM